MNEVAEENQAQKIGIVVGVLAVLLLLRRLRKRRKEKKLLKARAKARAALQEQRRKEAQKKTKERKPKKKGKGKEKSVMQQLVRFTILQVMKKVISQQVKQMEIDLGSDKLGKRFVQAVES